MGSRKRVVKIGQNVRQLAQCFHTPAWSVSCNAHTHTNRYNNCNNYYYSQILSPVISLSVLNHSQVVSQITLVARVLYCECTSTLCVYDYVSSM